MPPAVKSTAPGTVNRIIRYRPYPGDAEMGNRLKGKAEAWFASALTQVHLRQSLRVQEREAVAQGPGTVLAFFNPEQPGAGKPSLKGKYRTTPSFSIPCDIRIRDGLLRVPKVGQLRLKDHGQRSCHDHCQPQTVRIKKEGSDAISKWYAHVCCAVSVELLPTRRTPAPWAWTAMWASVRIVTARCTRCPTPTARMPGCQDQVVSAQAFPSEEGQLPQTADRTQAVENAPQTGANPRLCAPRSVPQTNGYGLQRGTGRP